MGTGEKQNGPCPMERGKFEDAKAVWNTLMCVACLAPGAMDTLRPDLQPMAISETMGLLQQGSMSMSMAPFATKFCVDTQCLGQHLKPCWCLRVMWPGESYRSEHPGLPTQGHSDFCASAVA